MKDVFSKRPYLSKSDQIVLTRMVDAGRITTFRLKSCARCSNDVPLHKTHCSIECYQKESHDAAQDDDEED
jgi:hypothetical protein